ncbi:endonuclease/exonuclease/phosphatase family metal-dependent hydrolase [Chitinivorax tropicus]|uniref:Endonuclease/exonuclease/phosphatase family metal-dependent hydrolase n=1 Tax=Chitinivorax tropicus TaxID=714531 RepID=A0A840MS46_9PROT|nr:endonuclease/exonuclease/phosphatase family metal-dependent hydrolase [Chitinivorax tropicus]
MAVLRIATYNIHKGMSQFNRRLTVHDLSQHLKQLHSDIIFLQEVQGAHDQQARRFVAWPRSPQHEFLADSLSHRVAYGRNAIYDDGHHGNAILSRFPIISTENQDVSVNPFEKRGLLHCEIEVPCWPQSVHAICVHLNLLGHDRKKQIRALRERIATLVPSHAPLIIAGDFNDWRQQATELLTNELHLREAFETLHGTPARSFPSRLPVLTLDRIYYRGFTIEHAQVHSGRPWSRISDHAPLSATMRRV